MKRKGGRKEIFGKLCEEVGYGDAPASKNCKQIYKQVKMNKVKRCHLIIAAPPKRVFNRRGISFALLPILLNWIVYRIGELIIMKSIIDYLAATQTVIVNYYQYID